MIYEIDMDIKFLEMKINELFAEAFQIEHEVGLNYIDGLKQSFVTVSQDELDDQINQEEELIRPFRYLLSALYNGIVCYLDYKGLNNYLELFFLEFGKPFNLESSISNFDYDHYYSGQAYNVVLLNMKNFLSVFEFANKSESLYLRISGIKYLENILESSSILINKCNPKPNTEPKVYNAMKDVLFCVFPNAKDASSDFSKIAQEYKPDILIPELKVAIEYKYADSEAKLKTVIDQIHADVKGYTGDDRYQLFYAVFYVCGKLWTHKKFHEVWKEKDFPENWRGIYILD